MPMITSADLERLSTAALSLYTPDLNLNNWVDRGFTFLSSLVSTDMVNYGCLNPRTQALYATTTAFGPEWVKAVAGFGEFLEKYPCFNFDPTVNEGRPFFRSDFMSARKFRDLDIYSECFEILETMDHAAVHVPSNDGNLIWFAAERGGRTDFDERDRILLAHGQAHLANSHKLAVARQNIRSEFTLKPEHFCSRGFTPREADVACWLTEGKTNHDIATLMKLQLQTVKGYVTTLFNKTGTGNRLALTLHLIEMARSFRNEHQISTITTVKSWPAQRLDEN